MSDGADSPSREPQRAEGFMTGYDSPDADLILISSDGAKFRVHSSIMTMASGFFKTMLALPRPLVEKEETEPITMEEDREALQGILGIIYPDRTFFEFEEPTFDTFKEACLAAEKYDMPGVLYSLRLYFWTRMDSFCTLPAYILMCHLKWKEEADMTATNALWELDKDTESEDEDSASEDKDSESEEKDSESEDEDPLEMFKLANGDDVARLFRLHLSRRDAVAAALNFSGNSEDQDLKEVLQSPCTTPRKHLNTSYLAALKYFIYEAMEKCSDGDLIREDEFWSQEGLDEVWNFQCACSSKPFFDKSKIILRVLREL